MLLHIWRNIIYIIRFAPGSPGFSSLDAHVALPLFGLSSRPANARQSPKKRVTYVAAGAAKASQQLGRLPGREPVRGLLHLYAELEALLPRMYLDRPDSHNGRNGEGHTWNTAIIGLAPLPPSRFLANTWRHDLILA